MEDSSIVKRNKLEGEKSPYLLQHAKNPVNWFPWGEEAFLKAREEDKPIFLSIGYSTCHWCHVMAHESFEDNNVADLMNDTFISIKVDREERPDIDKIYMTVCQLMTGQGGWPLTILMTHEKKPFFAGTYFPKETRFGRIGMIELTKRIQDLWQNNRKELLESSNKILYALQDMSVESPGLELDSKILFKAFSQLKGRFDEKFGGFGKAPKFPTPQNLLFLLRYWKRTGDQSALDMVEQTLTNMRKGGIYDHLGFGFHRYSTDRFWLVPHFEKMLYDQALLTIAYIETYKATRKNIYGDTAKEILTYILRDMTSSEGGFYSAEDADSEGVEGKFYVWSKDEIDAILSKEDAEIFNDIYTIRAEGNYLEEATKEKSGKNIPNIIREIPEELFKTLQDSRKKLFIYREKRIRPHLDDKILTDWNGLMIAAFAKAGFVFNEPIYTEAAEKATKFILTNLKNSDNRLLHRYRGGDSDYLAFIDDYAFLIWGLINLFESTFDVNYLKTAIEFQDQQNKYFWDSYIGGFYFTPEDGELLITRQKEIYDGAIPSGNSVSMFNLLRLYQLTGNDEYEKKANTLSKVFAEGVRQNPTAYTFLLLGVDYAYGPTYSLVIAGNPNQSDTNNMINSIRTQFLPNKSLIYRPTDVDEPEIDKYSNFVQFFVDFNDKATAYVCINKTCKPPTNEIDKALEYMS